jgi:hypothetical protein
MTSGGSKVGMMAPVDVGTTPTYKVDYKLGIMINYEVSKEALAPYVPKPLSPLAIRMLKDDQEPKYMVSLYLALCNMNDDPNFGRRADVFTYITDSKGHAGMLFLSVLCDIPPSVPQKYVAKFIEAQEQFFLDAETGKCPIPHQVIEELTMTQEGVHLKMGDTLFESKFKVQKTTLFHNEFVVSNSQIFHSGRNKTINYFNQEFISAPIHDVDLASVMRKGSEKFHPLCDDNKLDSVQFYGDDVDVITWYFKARL